MTEGYSGKPLAMKLGLHDGQRVWFDRMPDSVAEEIGDYALDLIPIADPADGIDAAHVFVTERARLEELLTTLRGQRPGLGQLAQESIQSTDRHHRRHHPRGRLAAGFC